MRDIIFDQTLVDISKAMEEPVLSAEEQIERKVDSIIRELDELVAMAANPETIDLIENERPGIGLIVSRSRLVASLLIARTPLRVVS
jgi:hypothetical protein